LALKNNSLLWKIGTIIFSVSLLVILIPSFGQGVYLSYMIPLWTCLFFVMTKSKIKPGSFFIIPLIITAAFIYVIFCDSCTALKKSIITTLWLTYISAMLCTTQTK